MATIISNSPEETRALGLAWAREMDPGWIVGLTGDLGSGKTQLVKGLAEGWNIRGQIASPTFNILHEHRADRGTLFHLDLYRLDSPEAIWDAGIADYFREPLQGWVIAEWVERWIQDDSMAESGQPDVCRPFRWVHIAGDFGQKRTIEYEDFRD
jgi:tRNA threonylcarbamoyladenosine biosynthesis protein TsaE